MSDLRLLAAPCRGTAPVRALLLQGLMKQLSFFRPGKYSRVHGGAHSAGKRRSRRPLSLKEPHHITLRSDFASGSRSLLRHRPWIERVLKKASLRFHVRIYEKAVCGNHIHLLVFGKSREGLQNFFRVVAGHIAQGILEKCPINPNERKVRGGAPSANAANGKTEKLPHRKNRRKFWALLLFSRVVTWGREFRSVCRYIVRNTLEALNFIAYTPRKRPRLPLRNTS